MNPWKIPHKILEWPIVYRALQSSLAPKGAVSGFVNEHMPIEPNSRILDIGCGPGDILSYLPQSVQYVGFDINRRYIDEARVRYGARGTFYYDSIGGRKHDYGSEYDVVLARAILHHLDDKQARELFQLAFDSLKPGGLLITLDCAFVPGQPLIAKLLAALDRGRFVRKVEGYIALARERFSDLEYSVTHDRLRVPYTHLVIKCRKTSSA